MVRQEGAGSWSSKGDVGSGTSYVSIAAYRGSSYVYVLSNDRAVSRATTGTSSTWSSWASAGNDDTSWVSLTMNDDYLYAIRNDGRVDRATISGGPSWTEEHSDAGSDLSFLGIEVEVPEFSFSVYLLIGLLCVFLRRRKNGFHRGGAEGTERKKTTEFTEATETGTEWGGGSG